METFGWMTGFAALVTGVGALPIVNPDIVSVGQKVAEASTQNPYYALYFLLGGFFLLVCALAWGQYRKMCQRSDEDRQDRQKAEDADRIERIALREEMSTNNAAHVKAIGDMVKSIEKLVLVLNSKPCIADYDKDSPEAIHREKQKANEITI